MLNISPTFQLLYIEQPASINSKVGVMRAKWLSLKLRSVVLLPKKKSKMGQKKEAHEPARKKLDQTTKGHTLHPRTTSPRAGSGPRILGLSQTGGPPAVDLPDTLPRSPIQPVY